MKLSGAPPRWKRERPVRAARCLHCGERESDANPLEGGICADRTACEQRQPPLFPASEIPR